MNPYTVDCRWLDWLIHIVASVNSEGMTFTGMCMELLHKLSCMELWRMASCSQIMLIVKWLYVDNTQVNDKSNHTWWYYIHHYIYTPFIRRYNYWCVGNTFKPVYTHFMLACCMPEQSKDAIQSTYYVYVLCYIQNHLSFFLYSWINNVD